AVPSRPQLQTGRQRGVIGNLAPDLARVRLGRTDVETAHIDAIQPQHRQPARETARRAATEYFGKAEPTLKQVLRAVVPVVEVPCDDQRRARRHDLLDTFSQCLHLATAAASDEAEMHAKTVC